MTQPASLWNPVVSNNVFTRAILSGQAIPLSTPGALYYVSDANAEGYYYYVENGGNIAVDGFNALATIRGGNTRWMRLQQSGNGSLQVAYFVDPQNSTGVASDSNDGLTSTTPLRTMAEFSRRIGQLVGPSLVTCNLLSNLTTSTDELKFAGFPRPTGWTMNTQQAVVFLVVQGQRTTATFTDPNTGSTTALTLTANATPPDVAAPSGATVTVAGFNWTPFLGKHIQVMTSGVAASVNTVGVIVKDLGAGVAMISALQIDPPLAAATQLATGSYPTTNSTIRIFDLTTWAAHAGSGMSPNTLVRFVNIEFTTASSQSIPNPYTQYNTCLFRRPIIPGSASGEVGAFIQMSTCSIIFAAPAAGRTPTQCDFTTGELRYTGCGFRNVALHIREKDASVLLNGGTCMVNSLVVAGSYADQGRPGSCPGLAVSGPQLLGLGMFDWPARGDLAPAPATTRGTFGAAIDVGRNSTMVIGTQLYGSSANANTTGLRVTCGAGVSVLENLSAQNPPPVTVPPDPTSVFALNLTGTLAGNTQLLVDDVATHIPGADMRTTLTGGAASVLTALGTWLNWETGGFARNAISLISGCRITNGNL